MRSQEQSQMRPARKKKKHLSLILLPLFAAIVAFCLIVMTGRTAAEAGSVTDHMDLGRQYLAEADYDAAIAQFTKALEIDPSNQKARVCLAQAYYGSGEEELADTILQDMNTEGAVDKEAFDELLDLYQERGDDSSALQVLNALIQSTDEEQYYEKKEEVISALLTSSPQLYARGTDQELQITDGKVQSRGVNTMGQLGTQNHLGQSDAQENYADAGFAGTPFSVFCAGRTSLVVDTDGNLWAAGSNRFGQEGIAYGNGDIVSGWRQVLQDGNSAAVFGSEGSLYLVRKDGTVWHCGGSGSGAGVYDTQTFVRVPALSDIIDVQYSINDYGTNVFLLDASGTLLSLTDTNGTLANQTTRGQEVRMFSLLDRSAGSYAYVNQSGELWGWNCEETPEGWSISDGGGYYMGYIPDFTVTDIGGNSTLLALLGADGLVRTVDMQGQVQVRDDLGQVRSVFGTEEDVYAIREDGTMQSLVS